MSSRALRRLRGEDEQLHQEHVESSSEEEEEDLVQQSVFFAAFSSSSSSSEDDDDDDDPSHTNNNNNDKDESKNIIIMKKKVQQQQEEEEDLDEILKSFAVSHDTRNDANDGTAAVIDNCQQSLQSLLLRSLNSKMLDMDYGMRAMLGTDLQINQQVQQEEQQQPPQNRRARRQQQQQQRGRQRQQPPVISRKNLYFGKQRDHWIRPPNYMGGGMGMKCVSGHDESLPQVYRQFPNVQWYTFKYSDTYTKIQQEFESVANVGDVNRLALFVAENPLNASALLQLSMVFAHTGNMEAATELLRRCIFVYESAALQEFFNGLGLGQERNSASMILMDSEKDENNGFFSALFRLMQISCMVGCLESAVSIAMFLFSLDPLRDPMGVLLTIDYFALATVKPEYASMVVSMIEADTLKIHPGTNGDECSLRDLPNWAYNYALALYKLAIISDGGGDDDDDDDDSSGTMMERANEALVSALRIYPSVLPKLLELNKVDVRGRSFQVDWASILPVFETESQRMQSFDGYSSAAHIIHIFVNRSHKLWKQDDVLKWLYKCAVEAMELTVEDKGGGKSSDTTVKSNYIFPAALGRYRRSDPSDYEDSFKRLPAEANPLDPALVVPALALDPNRRRLRRRPDERQAWEAGIAQDEIEVQRMLMQQLGIVMDENGHPVGGTNRNRLDPDSPLMELFVRSLLPWNNVDGLDPLRFPDGDAEE